MPDDQEVKIVLKYNEDKSKMYVQGKLISYPDRVDSDMDGISDHDDPNPMEYTITDRTLALVEGMSYTNLEKYVGCTVREAREAGVYFKNVNPKDSFYLDEAIIVAANDSAGKFAADFWDEGLGSVAVKFIRSNKSTSVIYALRGTEFIDDGGNDFGADLDLGIGWDTKQSRTAFKEYKEISSENKSYDYYVVGHSLGGRLAQDVLYKLYNANEGGFFKKKANIPTPVHNATFNGLGYNNIVYATLERDVISRYNIRLINFYYWKDLVGDTLGASSAFVRSGTDVMLYGKNSLGKLLREDENFLEELLPDSHYHGIKFFHDDFDLFYTSPHNFLYWAK